MSTSQDELSRAVVEQSRPLATRTRQALRWVAITALFVNIGIHLAMAPDHLAEMPYIGVLFVIGSALLGVVMVALASDQDRLRTLAWVGGTAICAAEFVLFILSRTIGLPGGYLETWAENTEDLLGLASLAVEVVFIACALASVGRVPRVRDPAKNGWMPLHDRTAPLA